LAYMEDEKADKQAGALWFLKNYQDVWHGWVPADVMKKVEEAL